MSPHPALLEVSGLHCAYSGRTVVHDLNLDLEPGTILGLLGQNGAGKTTTLKVIAGMIRPLRGSVRVLGEPSPWQNVAARRRVGFCPELPSLSTQYTVLRQLQLAARLSAISPGDLPRSVDRVLDLCDLGALRGERISQLSRGMTQRVSLAQSLVHQPDLLVLDEPVSGLDPIHAAQLRELLTRLPERTAVVFSSHSLSDTQLVCDQIMVLHQGRCTHQGSLNPAERARRYRLLVSAPVDQHQQAVLDKYCQQLAIRGCEIELQLDGLSRISDLITEIVALGAGIESCQNLSHLNEADLLAMLTNTAAASA